MIQKFLTLLLLVSVTSCGTATNPYSHLKGSALKNLSPADQSLAVVYIVRDDNFITNVALTAYIGIDQEIITPLNNNVFTRVEMPAGRHNFRFAVTKSEYKKAHSEYASGSQRLLIKPGVVNVVQFNSSDFELSNRVLYGKQHLSKIESGALYQSAYIPTVMLANKPPVQKTVASKASPIVKKAIAKPVPTMTSAQFVKLQAGAKCKLKNDNWAYTGTSCKNGLAHGNGSAEDTQGLKFVGAFASGQRTKGEIHKDGNMIFTGSLVDDKPDGSAICFYGNEYEECRFFKGKRIDTLYKIRKENALMKAEMAKMRATQPMNYNSAPEKGITDYAADAIQQEAADRAADFIFDKLF